MDSRPRTPVTSNIALSILFVITINICTAQKKNSEIQFLDFKFLSIGSSDYAVNAHGYYGYPNVPGANKSAQGMAQLFEQMGALEGTVLLSDQSHFITTTDILLETDKLIESIQKENKRCAVIFYYCGHGAAEGFSWCHRLIPGDYNCHLQEDVKRGMTHNLNTGSRMEYDNLDGSACMILGNVLDKFYNTGIPAFFFIDACYEGAPHSSFVNSFASDSIERGEIARNLCYRNFPVFFSNFPGSATLPAIDPFQDSSLTNVGPLYRRAVLALNKITRQYRSITLNDFFDQFLSPYLDSLQTPPPFYTTRKLFSNKTKVITNKRNSPFSGVNLKFGSGMKCSKKKCHICDSEIITETTDVPVFHIQNLIDEDSVYSFFQVEPVKYWDENPTNYLPNSSEMKLIQFDSSHIEFCFRQQKDTLHLVLAMQEGQKLAIGEYSLIYGNISERPCFSIKSAKGQYCGEGPSNFTIKEIKFNEAGKIQSIAIDYDMVCTSSDLPVIFSSGKLRFNSSLK